MSNPWLGYQSPFTWRYGSPEMRALWSEHNKRTTWRRIWVALAQAQADLGWIAQEQVADLRTHLGSVNVPHALAIEEEVKHDLVAELKSYCAQCPIGGAILHLGATSADIEDNSDAIRLRAALCLLLSRLRALLVAFAHRIEETAELPCMGFTHLQPAEPTTVGYRLSQYAQDLLSDETELTRVYNEIRGKGFKGAVGTSASYSLLGTPAGSDLAEEMERQALDFLGIDGYDVATQIYPRKQEWRLLNALAGIAMSLHKFAFDIRLLQSPIIGEWRESLTAEQVGSSAMPFKRNPVGAEKIDSLARLLAQLPRTAWDNGALSLLERTLDDSANRRVILPEGCLCCEELLISAQKLLEGLCLDKIAIEKNCATYMPFAATERLLMAAVKEGANRQELHEQLRIHSMEAWKAIQEGNSNPLMTLLCRDDALTRYLTPESICSLLGPESYLGNAPQRALRMAAAIRTKTLQPG